MTALLIAAALVLGTPADDRPIGGGVPASNGVFTGTTTMSSGSSLDFAAGSSASFADDVCAFFGTDDDVWACFDPTNGLEITTTNSNGSGADKLLVSIVDGTDNIAITADLIVADDEQVCYGTDSDVCMQWDNSNARWESVGTGPWRWEDGAGNAMMTITDGGTGGNVAITGTTTSTGVITGNAGSANAQGMVLVGRLELGVSNRIAWGTHGHMIGGLSSTDGRFAWSTAAEGDYVQLDVSGATKTFTTDDGDMSINPAGGDLTIPVREQWSPGSLISVDGATTFAVTRNYHNVDCVGAETITTATGGAAGQFLILLFNTDADVCTLTDTAAATADTFDLSAAFTSTTGDTISFIHNGTKWFEIGRGVN